MEPVFLALRVVLSLAVVLGLLWIVQRRLGRKSRKNNTGDLVTVVTRRGISQKASVVVVDVDGMRYLLGVTEQSVNVLGTSEAPVAEWRGAPTSLPSRCLRPRSTRPTLL